MKSPLYHYKEFKPEEEEQEGNRLGDMMRTMILNAIYFIPTVISIWTKPEKEVQPTSAPTFSFKMVCVAFIVINFILGIFFQPITKIIVQGLLLLG